MLLSLENDEIKLNIGMSDEDFYKATTNSLGMDDYQKELNNKVREIFEKLNPHQREIFKCFPYWNLIEKKENIGFNFSIELKDSIKNLMSSSTIESELYAIMQKAEEANKKNVEEKKK